MWYWGLEIGRKRNNFVFVMHRLCIWKSNCECFNMSLLRSPNLCCSKAEICLMGCWSAFVSISCWLPGRYLEDPAVWLQDLDLPCAALVLACSEFALSKLWWVVNSSGAVQLSATSRKIERSLRSFVLISILYSMGLARFNGNSCHACASFLNSFK